MAEDAVPKPGVSKVVEEPVRAWNTLGARPESGDVAVALQAHREDGRAVEQTRVGASVRVMATLASLGAHRSVLMHEWPSLVGMALRAGLVVAEGGRNHPGRVRRAPGCDGRPVGVVAVGARNGSLIDPMLERHFES